MAVDPLSGNAAPQIAGAIRQAAQSTGISFEYLLTTARIESNLNPTAKASTSSATGLYQFIEQTWLGTMKQDGPALGLGRYADAISRGSDGRYEVTDPTMRDAIMRLRRDPAASAMLAGAFTRANANQLSSAIGREPTEGELYIAHFLGPDGAGKLVNATARHPNASAAAMFPHAAAANHSIFYERSGSPRSVSGVYAKLTGKFEVARAVSFGPGQTSRVALAEPVPRPPAAVPVPAAVTVAPLPAPVATPAAAPVAAPATAAVATPMAMPVAIPTAAPASPDTAGITQAFAEARATLPPARETKPLFQAMFTDRVGQPVAPVVNSLWGAGRGEQLAAAGQGRGLDLFTDGRTDTRKLFGAG
jgi:hypothetical protein